MMENPIDNTRKHTNSFSYSKKHGFRLFTDFEILIQKIWYLLMNNTKVTKKAIDGLTEGYSCTCDELDESNIHETFKYATKLDLSAEDLTVEKIMPLEKALSGRRVIQGYGCLRGAIKDDESIDEDKIQATQRYYEAIAALCLVEEPVETLELLKEVVHNTFASKKTVYITKNTFREKL